MKKRRKAIGPHGAAMRHKRHKLRSKQGHSMARGKAGVVRSFAKGLGSILSFASVGSILSAKSLFSFASIGSILSVGSAGSILSIGSAGSILSIGSAGSILSIGSAGSILSIGGKGLRSEDEEEQEG